MADRERLVRTLMDLIRIDSPTGEEDAIDREVSARLKALGCDVKHDSFNNVIATLPGQGDPVMLSAHLDTVEPGRGINPILDGEVLRTDGSTILGGDCKAGVSIIMEALTAVVESGRPHLTVEVAFSRAEEGGLNGAHNMDFGLVVGPPAAWCSTVKARSTALPWAAPSQNIVQARIRGRAAHAGLEPEKGISALDHRRARPDPAAPGPHRR